MDYPLYLVTTPIGNLEDITLRALRILKEVDEIFCEDTRQTAKLLKAYNISKPLYCYADHNEQRMAQEIITKISQKKRIALVSDAGTPLISDPGYKLVRLLKEQNIAFTSLPGATSITTSLTLAGLPVEQFYFAGFLPSKNQARETMLTGLLHIKATIVTFETARRLIDSLQAIKKVFGEVEAAVVREISKIYEQAITLPISQLIEHFTENPARGEIVLLFHPLPSSYNKDELLAELKILLRNMSVKDSVTICQKRYNTPKNELYDLALSVKRELDL